VRQNEVMKRLAAGAALVAAPTLIAAIYGMNFETMAELHWRYGYPVSIACMAAACTYLYHRFRKSGWL